MFPSVSPKQSFPALESEVLAYWKANNTFQKSIDSRPIDNPYRFYDGPPFITGMPHYGSLLSSIVKDVVGRYWTMRGRRVDRTWGWDCHGLPIEEKVQKKLGLKSNKEIEANGVKNFIDECYKYTSEVSTEWNWYIDKIGRWVDMENAYRTMDQDYMESVMWVFSELYKKGLIYEGKRVSLYSWKLGTPISNFEVAMDDTYQEVNDPAITVKFALEPNDQFPDGTSILAWTTTPWTIPANMALAVRNDIDYVLVKHLEPYNDGKFTPSPEFAPRVKDDGNPVHRTYIEGNFILAKNRTEAVFKSRGEYTIIRKFKGSELVGLAYIPPFPEYYYTRHAELDSASSKSSGDPEINSGGRSKNHRIYHADFITDTDGTGIGHEAPEFGEVDFQLAKKEGIHISNAMDEAGRYTAEIHDMEGVHYLDLENPEQGANKINIERMRANNTLFKLEGITHRVPFCPRSGTPLMQKAQKSWFIDIQSQKDKLIEANEQINWFPEYLKEGRFKKGIETAPDWCISRTRYWGAPMPVWTSEDGEQLVVSSREEIFEMNKPYGQLTKIIFVRHGESIKNTEGIIDGTDKPRFPLTENGRKIAQETAEKLNKETISAIYSSPFARAQETAEIINSKHDLDIIFDERLREVFLGDMDGKKVEDINEHYWREHDKYVEDWGYKIGGGDCANDILERMKSFIQEVGKKHGGETIVIVSHADQIAIIKEYLTDKKAFAKNIDLPKVGEPISIYYDRSSEKQLNLHKPYIDSIKLQSPKTGEELTRIPEVLDVWMDSGSMPYAQMHYPFENKGEMEASFPADFIAEYVGQLRAWFYVMHVLGVLLNPTGAAKPTPSFTNVITTGVINGNDGRKMSKSFGNYPDPRITIEKYGADPIRFYMLNSPLLSGGDMDFKEEQIIDTVKGVMLPIWNTYSFFTTYANIDNWTPDDTEVWFSRHGQSVSNTTGKMSDHTDDPELTTLGREQSQSAGKSLKEQGKNFDIIIHTSRVRARDTAEIMGSEMGYNGEYIVDDRFAEQSAGEYAGMTIEDIARTGDIDSKVNYPSIRKIYKNNATENIEQFEKRILEAYTDILTQHKGKRVLIVAHAGTSRPILNQYFGMGTENAHYDTTIQNAEPFRLMTTSLVNDLDRWILSKLQVLIGQVHDAMEGYDISRGCRAIVDYMDELTNWYVRLSRRRFWESGMTPDKKSAYETLHTVLVEVSKLLAPFMPFISEDIYRGLTEKESVHLEYITRPNRHLVSNDLNRDMEICEHIVSLGLTIRSRQNIRVRQPLQKVILDTTLSEYYLEIVKNELNVKEVICEKAKDFTAKICKVNARKVGPKYGKDMQEIIYWGKQGDFQENSDGTITINPNKFKMGQSFHYKDGPVTNNGKSWVINSDDGEIVRIKVELEEWVKKELGGYLEIEEGFNMVIALDTTISDSLKVEGYARDIVRLIQDMRKEAGYEVSDRISLSISGEGSEAILRDLSLYITRETLSTLSDQMDTPDRMREEPIGEGSLIQIAIKR